MTEWFKRDLTTLAFLWRLERSDGVAIGFTSHDYDLVRSGMRYRSAPGMLPSAIRRTSGFDVDDVDLDGALTSGAITEADLRMGRWDGARLTLSAVDWTAASEEAVVLVRGTLGAVAIRGETFSVSLRGPTAVLDRAVAEATSPSCRAQLGDRRCRVDLSARRSDASVVAIDNDTVTLAAVPGPDGAFGYGTLRWLDGALAGIESRVMRSAGVVLTLAEAPERRPALPVRVRLTQGCDLLLATCRDRFANIANFRGEPHLPGNDVLTRYGQ